MADVCNQLFSLDNCFVIQQGYQIKKPTWLHDVTRGTLFQFFFFNFSFHFLHFMADFICLTMASQYTEESSSSIRNPLFRRSSSSQRNEPKVHVRIVPSIENPSRSLIFSIIERDLEAGKVIKIGRFTDKSSVQNHISFKSKVVSRSHCEVWLNHEGKVSYYKKYLQGGGGGLLTC